jgi:hypothetical protein
MNELLAAGGCLISQACALAERGGSDQEGKTLLIAMIVGKDLLIRSGGDRFFS